MQYIYTSVPSCPRNRSLKRILLHVLDRKTEKNHMVPNLLSPLVDQCYLLLVLDSGTPEALCGGPFSFWKIS